MIPSTPQVRIFNKQFKQVRKLADTLQGHIYLALDIKHNNKKVVIKETFKRLVEVGKSRDGHVVHEDFHKEKEILTILSQQPDADNGFVRIIQEWYTDDCFYYAMEYCEAELFKFISNAFANNGEMARELKISSTLKQVASVSNAAHDWMGKIRNIFQQLVKACYWMQTKGVCHLDLSLENTMIFKVDGLRVKVIDFGLAKYFDINDKNNPKIFTNAERVGKRGYMAPEVYAKQVYNTRKADVWSLGVMLFMMLVGAPPYKRATNKDAAFGYIMNGMLEDVLKHWKRLRLVSRDALDCMKNIFKKEKERMSMEELVAHPWVGLAHLLERNNNNENNVSGSNATGDSNTNGDMFDNPFVRIRKSISEYHSKYLISEQENYMQEKLVNIKPKNVKRTALKMPHFVDVCSLILGYGNQRLTDDFATVLRYHDPSSNSSDMKNAKSFHEMCQELIEKCKVTFIEMNQSIIIRRNYRDRQACEDEKQLLSVYGESNKNVLSDDEQRMAMQICDKMYNYFAYSIDLGMINDDEKEKNIELDLKELCARIAKKQKKCFENDENKNKYGSLLRERFAMRKIKFVTNNKCAAFDDVKEQSSKPNSDGGGLLPPLSYDSFHGMKSKMQNALTETCEPMQHNQLIEFVNTELRNKADFSSVSSAHWDLIIAKMKQNHLDEQKVLDTKKQKFINIFVDKKSKKNKKNQAKLKSGTIVKLHAKLMSSFADRRPSGDTVSSLEKCPFEMMLKVLKRVLVKELKLDYANCIDEDVLVSLLQKSGIDGGSAFLAMDDGLISWIITNSLVSSLRTLDGHRFGKRLRYWPSYKDNECMDLLNGFYMQHWYVKPRFNDIKDEILNNGLSAITVSQWNRTVLYASKVVIRSANMRGLRAKTDNTKRLSASNAWHNKYGVSGKDRIRLEHLVPLLIYVNLDFVSKSLVQSYCNLCTLKDYTQWVKQMRYHSQLAHLARLVRECVECFGESRDEKNSNFSLYHILGRDVRMTSLNARMLSPASMTSSLNTAIAMCDYDNEMVVKFDFKNARNVCFFNVSWISDYPNEFEYLFVGGMGAIEICDVLDLNCKMQYENEIIAMHCLMKMVTHSVDHYDGFDKQIKDIKKTAVAMNSLIQNRITNDENENNYVSNLFAEITLKIKYISINVSWLKKSQLMSAVLMDSAKQIKFEVLSRLFTSVNRYFVDMKGLDLEEQKSLILNDALFKFLETINQSKMIELCNRMPVLKSLKFDYLDLKLKNDVNAAISKNQNWECKFINIHGDNSKHCLCSIGYRK